MATRILSRLLAAIILGGVLAVACFTSDTKDARLGIAQFLKGAESRFYDIETNAGALLVDGVVGIFISLAVFGVYELVAYGIFKLLDRLDRRAENENPIS